MTLDTDLDQLADVVSRLRRALRRGVRPVVPHEALPPAQVEVLQHVGETPGLHARDLTAQLLLAPTTVSTLIGQLLDRGLLERRPHATDRRAWHLHPTAAGREALARWQDAQSSLLKPAIKTLPKADRQAIRAALPALGRLVAALDAGDGPETAAKAGRPPRDLDPEVATDDGARARTRRTRAPGRAEEARTRPRPAP